MQSITYVTHFLKEHAYVHTFEPTYTFSFIRPAPASFLRTWHVGEVGRRAPIMGCKSWRNGTKLNVSVLANLVERGGAVSRPRRKLAFAFCPHARPTIRGDKDVTLHPIMALLVGAIMFHVRRIRIHFVRSDTRVCARSVWLL